MSFSLPLTSALADCSGGGMQALADRISSTLAQDAALAGVASSTITTACDAASNAAKARRRRRRALLAGCDDAVDVTAVITLASPTSSQISQLKASLRALLLEAGASGLGAGTSGAVTADGAGWLSARTQLWYESVVTGEATTRVVGGCENDWAESVTDALSLVLSVAGTARLCPLSEHESASPSSITATSPPPAGAPSGAPNSVAVGVIVGSVLGALLGLYACCFVAFFVIVVRRRKQRAKEEREREHGDQEGPHPAADTAGADAAAAAAAPGAVLSGKAGVPSAPYGHGSDSGAPSARHEHGSDSGGASGDDPELDPIMATGPSVYESRAADELGRRWTQIMGSSEAARGGGQDDAAGLQERGGGASRAHPGATYPGREPSPGPGPQPAMASNAMLAEIMGTGGGGHPGDEAVGALAAADAPWHLSSSDSIPEDGTPVRPWNPISGKHPRTAASAPRAAPDPARA
ncbi:hypothetical protein FOA52_011932 [Chlamydomonas sp. UWO 241]|nr:hypothetical protein FOA52_011932 [Chlamydomonas sp. UWO 241]